MLNPFRRPRKPRDAAAPAEPWIGQVRALMAWTPPDGVAYSIGIDPTCGNARFILSACCTPITCGVVPDGPARPDLLHAALDRIAALVLAQRDEIHAGRQPDPGPHPALDAAHEAFVAGIGGGS